ncbi:MAG TPA: hypothetical protein VFZ58_00395 [Candidatus Saccharimonadales bacterium]
MTKEVSPAKAKKAQRTKYWWQLWRPKPKKKELTEAEKQAQLKAIREKDQELLAEALSSLEGPYGIYAQRRPQWEREVTKTLHARWQAEWAAREEMSAEAARRGITDFVPPPYPQTSRLDIEKEFAEKAANDLAALNAELGSMQVRTSIVMTIATVLFAVYTLTSGENETTGALVGLGLLGLALLFNGVAFACAISPLAPPFRRAWKSPYDKRHIRTLIVRDYFTSWCHDNWLGERRTPIITKYKKMHALAVPLLKGVAVVAVPGTILGFIFP